MSIVDTDGAVFARDNFDNHGDADRDWDVGVAAGAAGWGARVRHQNHVPD